VQRNGDVKLIYFKSEGQLANLFTKPLPISKFKFLRKMLGVCNS
jgi:hypothetical protein